MDNGQLYNHFNPRAPYGARPWPSASRSASRPIFQSTRPLRGATEQRLQETIFDLFQSTRPLRGATRRWSHCCRHRRCISIHAPLTGRDEDSEDRNSRRILFQSTRPLRGATPAALPCWPASPWISIHAPLTGRDCGKGLQIFLGQISIHAPLTGRDDRPQHAPVGSLRISIHAPLTGRDTRLGGTRPHLLDFNPRAPYGARPRRPPSGALPPYFNPRAPYGARQQKCTNDILHFCNNRQLK